jgi:CBS domain-containing protein
MALDIFSVTFLGKSAGSLLITPGKFFSREGKTARWGYALGLISLSAFLASGAVFFLNKPPSPWLSGGIFVVNGIGMVLISAAFGFIALRLTQGSPVSFGRLFSIYAFAGSLPMLISWLPGSFLATEHITAPAEEKQVAAVMVPIEEYTVLRSDLTIREALGALKDSFSSKIATSRLMETGHRSVLVTDEDGVLAGLLTIRGLLEAIMPSYLTAPKPSTADALQYSPMFWSNMFSTQIRQLGEKQIKTAMSPAPFTIDATANLMEAAYMMLEKNDRRLAVLSKGVLVGVIREQDLFFEMERILGS